MCPKNVCLVLKSVAVSKKMLALDPEAGVRALTKSTWSLQRCPLVLKREGLGNQKATLDTKWRFWTLKRGIWSLKKPTVGPNNEAWTGERPEGGRG